MVATLWGLVVRKCPLLRGGCRRPQSLSLALFAALSRTERLEGEGREVRDRDTSDPKPSLFLPGSRPARPRATRRRYRDSTWELSIDEEYRVLVDLKADGHSGIAGGLEGCLLLRPHLTSPTSTRRIGLLRP